METAVALSVIKFNHGARTYVPVMQAMGLEVDLHTVQGFHAEDDERLYFARKKALAPEKRKR